MQEMNFILSCYMLTLILIDSSYLHDVFTSLCPALSLLLQLHVPKPKTTIPDPKRKKNRNKLTREYTDVCLQANQPLSWL